MTLQGLDAKVKDKAWKMITLRKRRLVGPPHKVQSTMQVEEMQKKTQFPLQQCKM